jgi:glutamyl-tRNA(Gln) amidotransferase subunit E
VRFFGIGGIFHSDELPNYGIERDEVEKLRQTLKLQGNDGFLIIAGPKDKIGFALDALINRIKEAKNGVPAETRMATQSGETVFLRPRPGSARMYPETDIPPVLVSNEELQAAKDNIPRPWEQMISELQKKYGLNPQLAEQIFDSDYLDLFETICTKSKVSPNFVASSLCSTTTNLQRQGLDAAKLKQEHVLRVFELLDENKVTKESVEMIFEGIMSGKFNSPDEFAKTAVDEKELEKFLDDIVNQNIETIKEQGLHSTGLLMGLAMKSFRGKVSGEKLNKLLESRITKILEK